MSDITFRSGYMCNAEWTINPETIEIYLNPEMEERIKTQAKALKESGGNVMITWWAARYELFRTDDDGKDEVFYPEYSLDGCHMHVYADGEFSFHLPFKHSSEEALTQTFEWSEGTV